jgi:hypothetical protein
MTAVGMPMRKIEAVMPLRKGMRRVPRTTTVKETPGG